jgi:hypothetical protein
MTSAEFNVDIGPVSFTIAFPPGSRMSDERSREEWIIKANGEKRPILRGDIGATYEQMINSDPGEALGGKRTPFLLTWPGVLLLSIGIVALGTVIWRRFPRRVIPGPRPG